MKKTEEEIEHSEKYKTAFHEIGHTHILRRFGGCAIPIIWKNPTSTTQNNEKSWIGTTKVLAWPGQVHIGPGIVVHPVPTNWKVLVGLAGLVTEYMHCGEDSSFEIAGYIEENICYDELSESDRRMIGEQWSEDDVQELMKIFSEDWELIEESVKRLIFSCS